MFTINQGFDLNSPQFNFKRDYFATVAELKAADENGFPDHFITNVDGVLYQLTKSNTVDTTTGKWRKVSVGGAIDTDSNIAYVNKTNTFNANQTVYGTLKATTGAFGSINKNASSKYLPSSVAADKSDTKVYNTNGGLTDVSVYAKSTDVSSTYAKKSEAVSNINVQSIGQSLFITETINGKDTSINVPIAKTATDGVMSAADKAKLDGIAANANNYTLPTASTTAKGGVQLGYTATGKNYPLNVDANGKAYVNVPWTDTKTDISDCAKLSKDNTFSGNSTFMKDALFAGAIKISDGLIINQDTAIKNGITTGAILHIQNIIGNGSQTANPAGISTNGGTANKLFATDGSLFDASTLATKESLNGYVSNQNTTISTSLNNNTAILEIGDSETNGLLKIYNNRTGDSTIDINGYNSAINMFNKESQTTFSVDANAGNLLIGLIANEDDSNGVLIEGNSGNIAATGVVDCATVNADKIVKKDGTSKQFLKADGSVDSNTYVTTNTVQALSNKTFTTVTTAKGFSAMETNNRASNKFFATDGTIQETVAITEDEINALF